MILENREVVTIKEGARAPEKIDRSKIRIWVTDTSDGKFVALFQYFPPEIAEQLNNGKLLADCGFGKRYTWLKTSYHWAISQQRRLYPDHPVFALFLPESTFEELLHEAKPIQNNPNRVPVKYQIDPDRNSNGGLEYVEDAIGGNTKLATLHFAVLVGSKVFSQLSNHVSRIELLDLEKGTSGLVNLGLQEAEYFLPTRV